VRISPDRQTLILAGEALPRRSVAGSNGDTARNSANSRITIISARLEAVVTESGYSPNTYVPDTHIVPYEASEVSDPISDSALPATISKSASALTSRAYSTYAASSRGSSFGGASAYARTQDLSERHPIIDTYA
jgi:hypothetical protein